METITIVCDDHPGIIAEVSEIAASTGTNIESFEAKTVGTLAVVSISVDKHDETLLALSRLFMPSAKMQSSYNWTISPGRLPISPNDLNRKWHLWSIRCVSLKI